MTEPLEISEAEKDELLILIRDLYGYDLTNYAAASMRRRINRFAFISHHNSYFDLKLALLNDSGLFKRFVQELTVNVTEMFRDPSFYKCLKEKIFPQLETYPFIKIWSAGCSTGEEVYSLAILLTEQGHYDRSRIYATDLNPEVINLAKEGIYPQSLVKEYSSNYLRAGGEASLSDYYTARYQSVLMQQQLKQNLIFSQHNLVSDSVFNEFNLILCRNVLIYFNKTLQERVLGLFYESLSPLGFLALGSKESLRFSKWEDYFEIVDRREKIYRKKA